MKLFACQNCSQLLYFENDHCEKCSASLGFLPESLTLSVIEEDEGSLVAKAEPERAYRRCANSENDVCNWLVSGDDEQPYCIACRTNRALPDLSNPTNLIHWRAVERAKRHLFYTLMRLGLEIRNRQEDPECGLAFDFLAQASDPTVPVMTGHDNGVITLNLDEANDAQREQIRLLMREPYRTLLGHLRHEVGHYFWDELVDRGGRLTEFRECFGDERADYATALATYYANGPLPEWQNSFVSAYASAHAWEDFAETWAHYLHIVDTLEMAHAFGLRLAPPKEIGAQTGIALQATRIDVRRISEIISQWLPVTYAVNSINRCMGQPDLYPFVLSPAVIAKLGFVHDLINQRRRGSGDIPASDPPAMPE